MDRVAIEPMDGHPARRQRSPGFADPGWGGTVVGEAVSRGMRLRLARLALEEAIRADAAARERCRREEFDRALAAIVDRVARRTPAPAWNPPVPPARPVSKQALVGSASAPAVPARRPLRARRSAPPPVPPPCFWSPAVVLGFRMWEMRGKLWGARLQWDRPEHEARCLSSRTRRDHADVPHTDGRCGHPPCGLYCFREPEQLLAAFGLPGGARRVVLGLVALSGKVVEHERGYRAQRARVLAAAVVGRGRVIRVEGRARLQDLYARPGETVEHLLATDPGVVWEVADSVQAAEEVISYLTVGRDFHRNPGG